ncbi:PGF-CTERM sorting domain-containing protein [Halorubrum ezzemoulense DSM 17463]|uniref:PGF-CTERM sorting domain-containing protein n=1 Tax=Halorubrum ezzemoulense DSM 17463 TaxID=1121945 RepID=A0A1X4H9R8_HALEZ|nr:PGF-CTERM sorting domain-containing protein [Halorubrum ezzemoulense]OSP09748.1 PGF-CTERM sorting domain-containing protein [Halorubrum ezzemoulense DSM 17463]
MDTRTALLAAAAALLVASAVGAVAVPGAITDPRETNEPPGRIDVAGATVAPGEVRGETAELRLGTDLRHRGSTVENVTVRHRAIGSESGLLVDETTVDVGDVNFEGEQTVNGTVDVEREGGYRIETVVFADGQRREEQTTRVGGVAALTPDYADTRVGFTDGTVWPTVAVSVTEADNETATLSASISVTNRGDEPSDDVELRLYLRQAESNVIAGEATETVGTVRPGRTDTVTATVKVPNGYNYYVDAALFDDDVLVDETQGVANLNPQETLSANETARDVQFTVEDFERGEGGVGGDSAGDDGATRDGGASGDATPGFGPLVALVALVVTALLARRRR